MFLNNNNLKINYQLIEPKIRSMFTITIETLNLIVLQKIKKTLIKKKKKLDLFDERFKEINEEINYLWINLKNQIINLKLESLNNLNLIENELINLTKIILKLKNFKILLKICLIEFLFYILFLIIKKKKN